MLTPDVPLSPELAFPAFTPSLPPVMCTMLIFARVTTLLTSTTSVTPSAHEADDGSATTTVAVLGRLSRGVLG